MSAITIGQTLSASDIYKKGTDGSHELKLTVLLNSINKTDLTANVTVKCILITKYLS